MANSNENPFAGVLPEPVELGDMPDPIPGTDEFAMAEQRDRSTRDISAMPWSLEQLPEHELIELHDRIVAAERRLITPNLLYEEYEAGTAEGPDHIELVRGVTPGHLFTAEHATSPFVVVDKETNRKEYRFPDRGTGGLAAVLGEDFGTALIMRGQQTSNVPSDPNHPIKPMIREELRTATGFLAVHGKNPGMFVRSSDPTEIHACIGLGDNPSDALHEFARTVVRTAGEDLGLYVVISNDQPAYIQESGSTKLKREKDGTAKLSQLAALGAGKTPNFSRRVLKEFKRDVPTMQIELTDLLRLTPGNDKKDRVATTIGVALGYKLFQKVVELTPTYRPAEL